MKYKLKAVGLKHVLFLPVVLIFLCGLFMICAVSAVRLMRIQHGGAFADLLNEKGKGSGDNEMGYVERTLGFRTRDLDDRDLRLVIPFFCSFHFVLVMLYYFSTMLV